GGGDHGLLRLRRLSGGDPGDGPRDLPGRIRTVRRGTAVLYLRRLGGQPVVHAPRRGAGAAGTPVDRQPVRTRPHSPGAGRASAHLGAVSRGIGVGAVLGAGYHPGSGADPYVGAGDPPLAGGVGVSAGFLRRRAGRRLGHRRGGRRRRGVAGAGAARGPDSGVGGGVRNATRAAVTATLRDSTPLARGMRSRCPASAAISGDTPWVSLPST